MLYHLFDRRGIFPILRLVDRSFLQLLHSSPVFVTQVVGREKIPVSRLVHPTLLPLSVNRYWDLTSLSLKTVFDKTSNTEYSYECSFAGNVSFVSCWYTCSASQVSYSRSVSYRHEQLKNLLSGYLSNRLHCLTQRNIRVFVPKRGWFCLSRWRRRQCPEKESSFCPKKRVPVLLSPSVC